MHIITVTVQKRHRICHCKLGPQANFLKTGAIITQREQKEAKRPAHLCPVKVEVVNIKTETFLHVSASNESVDTQMRSERQAKHLPTERQLSNCGSFQN